MGYYKGHVKIPVDLFEYEEIIELEKTEMGRKAILLYLKIMLKAHIKHPRDKFYVARGVELNNNAIYYIFDVEPEDCDKCLELLERQGMIIRKSWYIQIFKIWKSSRDRSSKEYTDWRKSVFERDKYTCQICKSKGGKLNAHHIKQWSKNKDSRYEVGNGITLCESCHKKLHKGLVSLDG